MKNRSSFIAPLALVLTAAAFAVAGCSKGASVEGPGTGKLTLVKPGAVTVHRGGMAKADIQIKRADLAGDVTIHFSNLPKGIEVVDADSKIVGDKGSYTLRAADGADLVENFSADVTASAGPGDVSVTQPINISVKEKN